MSIQKNRVVNHNNTRASCVELKISGGTLPGNVNKELHSFADLPLATHFW